MATQSTRKTNVHPSYWKGFAGGVLACLGVALIVVLLLLRGKIFTLLHKYVNSVPMDVTDTNSFQLVLILIGMIGVVFGMVVLTHLESRE
jgi:cell division protein FtsX